MLGIVNYEVFIVAGILLNLTPGNDTMYILSRSMSQGRMAGIMSVLGIQTGVLIHTLLAAFGLSVVLAKSAFLFNAIKWIGVAYLVYLGIKMIMAKASDSPDAPQKPLKPEKVYLQGILTSIMNPKVALFFIAFLPQFIGSGDYGPLPFIVLGLTFTVTGGIWCTIIAIFASLATHKLRNNPKFGAILNKAAGIVFIAMGLNLIRAKATQ